MSDLRKADGTVRLGDSLVELATTFGTAAGRLANTVVAVPLAILPVQARDGALKAASDVINAIGSLHSTVLKSTVRGVETATSTFNKAVESTTPKK